MLNAQKQAFQRDVPTYATRYQNLCNLENGLYKYEKQLYQALYQDLGKNEFESFASEFQFVQMEIKLAKRKLKQWMSIKKVRTPLYLLPARSYIVGKPFGSVCIIGSFNYPLQLLLLPCVGALASGNRVILKPSMLCENVAKCIDKMTKEFFDKEFLATVLLNEDDSKKLLQLPFDSVFFTGSISTGKSIAQQAIQQMIPYTLELGGKCPVFIDESVSFEKIVPRIIWGRFMNAGQTCVAPEYVFVPKHKKEAFIKCCIEQIETFYGKQIQENKDFGRIVNAAHMQRLISLLKLHKEQIVYGGAYDEQQKYMQPTIIEIQDVNASIMEEEVFGPILTIIAYQNINDMIHYVQKRPNPLALYIFSKDKKFIQRIQNKILAGGVCINDTISHILNPNLPFGGVRHSGVGKYHGKASYDTFTHYQSVLKRSTLFTMKVAFPPFTKNKFNLLKKVLK